MNLRNESKILLLLRYFGSLDAEKKANKLYFGNAAGCTDLKNSRERQKEKKKGRDFTISALFRIVQTRGGPNFTILVLLFHPSYWKNQRQNKKSNKISLNHIISDLHTLKKQNKIYVISMLRLNPNCIWFSVSLTSPKFPSLRCDFSVN